MLPGPRLGRDALEGEHACHRISDLLIQLDCIKLHAIMIVFEPMS